MLSDGYQEINNLQSLQKKHFKSASSADLYLDIYSRRDIEEINQLRMALNRLKWLPKFKVNMITNDSEVLSRLCSCFRRLPGSSKLALMFSSYLSSRQLAIISKEVSNLTSLSSLNLEIAVDFDMKAVRSLIDCFRLLPKLKALSICQIGVGGDLGYYKNPKNSRGTFGLFLNEQGLKQLCLGLSHQKNLQSLALGFQGNSNLNVNTIQYLISTLKHLTLLSSLSLNLGDCSELNDKAITNLSVCLAPMTSLRSLGLNLTDCPQLNSASITELSKTLCQLTGLSSLTLKLIRYEDTTNKGILALVGALKNLKSLVHLAVDLSMREKQNNKIIQTLSTGLEQLGKLTSVSLELDDCMLIDDNGLQTLVAGLKSLTALSTLELRLSWSKLITDKGLMNIARSFKRFPGSLESLTLDLSWCHYLTSRGVQTLLEEARSLTHLCILSVNFSECRQVEDNGIIRGIVKELNRCLEYCDVDFSKNMA